MLAFVVCVCCHQPDNVMFLLSCLLIATRYVNNELKGEFLSAEIIKLYKKIFTKKEEEKGTRQVLMIGPSKTFLCFVLKPYSKYGCTK